MSKEKYDLIFSIGEACSCSQALRRTKLQKFSYPLDWLYGSDFAGRVNLLCSDFKDFCNYDDLEDLGQNNNDTHNLCNIYSNKVNGIVFNHDFPSGVSLEQSYPEVQAKYDRRISRLLEQIKKSKKVLIVFVEIPNSPDKLSDNEILHQAYDKIKNKFIAVQINLLYLSSVIGIDYKKRKTEKITPNITKVVFDYRNSKPSAVPYTVNSKILRKFFHQYALRKDFCLLRFFKNIFVKRVKND